MIQNPDDKGNLPKRVDRENARNAYARFASRPFSPLAATRMRGGGDWLPLFSKKWHQKLTVKNTPKLKIKKLGKNW